MLCTWAPNFLTPLRQVSYLFSLQACVFFVVVGFFLNNNKGLCSQTICVFNVSMCRCALPAESKNSWALMALLETIWYNPWSKHRQLKQVAQGHVHLVLSISKDGDSITAPNNLNQCLTTEQMNKKLFPMFTQNFLYFNLCPSLLWWCYGAPPLRSICPVFLTHPPSGIDAHWYDPMGPSLLQDEYSQLSQPFLSGENVESLAKVKVNNIHCSPFIYRAGHLIVESWVGWPWFHFCWSTLISPKHLGLFAPSPFLDTGKFVVCPQ